MDLLCLKKPRRRLLFAALPLLLLCRCRPIFGDELDDICGTYRRAPVQNDWHVGTISRKEDGTLEWRNKAGVAWSLTPDLERDSLHTDETNPYFNERPDFALIRRAGKVVGFRFGGEDYLKDGANVPLQTSTGLHAYIVARLDPAPADFRYGYSFYSTAVQLLAAPIGGFQVGMAGTWITPDNSGFGQPLLPPETAKRFPDRAPTYDGVFQTLEGGMGYWASTRFAAAWPKFRMNSTPDGYEHELSSPGWGFGRPQALAEEELGVAQLSNRLLVPPDGITFDEDPQNEIMGMAWMALPLVPGDDITGDQSWTFFANSANFAGPVAFWVPDAFSRLSRRYAVVRRRGLDARPGVIGGIGMEIGEVPGYEAKDRDGVVYARIPRITFPVDKAGRVVLAQDVTAYSKQALFNGIESFNRGGKLLPGAFGPRGSYPLKMAAQRTTYSQGENKTEISGIDGIVKESTFGEPPTQFGLEWSGPAGAGRFPEYFKERDGKMVPIAAADVPSELGLGEMEFAPPEKSPAYASPEDAGGAWTTPGPKAGPFQARLKDGSVVTYWWYRFIDQPAIVAQHWSADKRDRLQKLVERIHADWPINGAYMPAPSRGRLVTLDRALIVTPPAGLETGFVPIVTRQEPGERAGDGRAGKDEKPRER